MKRHEKINETVKGLAGVGPTTSIRTNNLKKNPKASIFLPDIESVIKRREDFLEKMCFLHHSLCSKTENLIIEGKHVGFEMRVDHYNTGITTNYNNDIKMNISLRWQGFDDLVRSLSIETSTSKIDDAFLYKMQLNKFEQQSKKDKLRMIINLLHREIGDLRCYQQWLEEKI
jgi:hypothetical protein